MNKTIVKIIFYGLYLGAGAIVSQFLPEQMKFICGCAFALLSRWAWKVISIKTEDHENEEGGMPKQVRV